MRRRRVDTASHPAATPTPTVKPYLVSLAIGLVVGGFYALLRVRSPAPPVIALVGLLGMLAGEQGLGLLLDHLRPPAPAATISTPSIQEDRHAP